MLAALSASSNSRTPKLRITAVLLANEFSKRTHVSAYRVYPDSFNPTINIFVSFSSLEKFLKLKKFHSKERIVSSQSSFHLITTPENSSKHCVPW